MISLLALLLSFHAQAANTQPTQENPVKLYFAANAVVKNNCHGGTTRTCATQIKKLNCHWPNEEKSTYANCTYEDANGKSQHLDGKKARRLVNAILAQQKVELDGAAGSRGFQMAQDLSCTEKTVGRKKPVYECQLAAHSDSCLPPKEQEQLSYLRDKYEYARSKNPSCVSRRGAGACLSPRAMLDLARLERKEEQGCRQAVHDSGFDRNQKPTMDAK
jgi:hypothetical protein